MFATANDLIRNLTVKYKKKNIYEVLQMNRGRRFEIFKDIPAISDRLQTLLMWIGYVALGQFATTLSGRSAASKNIKRAFSSAFGKNNLSFGRADRRIAL